MDAICSLKSDVIFLSDIRMGQIINQQSTLKISTCLNKSNLRNHLFVHNSSSNKRGVAMLINKSLNPEIVDSFMDQQENILLMKIKLNGSEIVLGSIYGPNTTDRQFYRDLDKFLEKHSGCPVVLGGDWNATWSNLGPDENNDIMGMIRTPNVANGTMLKNLASKYDLTDPFRILYPTKKAFSYSPFGNTHTSQSRLDFFIASTTVLGNIQDCGIFPGKLSSQFDHKPVF
jgi:exonuclease III